MTPTIGRIVIVKGLSPHLNNGAFEAPAVLTRVWGESEPGRWTVNLRVIGDCTPGSGQEWFTSVFLFDEASDGEDYLAAGMGPRVVAFWPPRVADLAGSANG